MSSSLRFSLTGQSELLVACGETLRRRGHAIVQVVSDCVKVTEWASRAGLPLAAVARDASTWATIPAHDYLLSIVNHAVLPPEALRAPERLPINYHDSLLPDYAGFNATAWAILDGRTTHGVTWHVMTADADHGDVLAQHSFPVDRDDTAYTLSVKCGDACVVSFERLIEQLELGVVDRTPQAAPQRARARSERPSGILDFTHGAPALDAEVRALDFGHEESWMTGPKVVTANGAFVVRGARVVDAAAQSPAGVVISAGEHAVTVAAGDGAIALTSFTDQNGDAVTARVVAERLGIDAGATLHADADFIASARAFDAGLARHERYWVSRLATLEPASLADLGESSQRREKVLAVRAPVGLAALNDDDRLAAIAAALAAVVMRAGDANEFDIGISADVPESLAPVYATIVPLRCTVDPRGAFAELRRAVHEELTQVRRRGTYARDVVMRRTTLRTSRVARALPVALLAGDVSASRAKDEGVQLALVVSADGSLGWAYNEHAIAASSVASLNTCFETLLGAALENGAMAAGALPILPSADVDRILKLSRGAPLPHATETVHAQFVRQAHETPDAIAVIDGGVRLTYRALRERVAALAHTLASEGAGPGTLVGVCLERSADIAVSILAILEAGAAYVPLDPSFPRERLRAMVDDAGATLIVAGADLAPTVSGLGTSIVHPSASSSSRTAPHESQVAGSVEDLAYVMFTSGSTGRPKGIMVEHRNVVSFFAAMDLALGRGPGVWLAATSISFDISVLELLWTLTRGFTVVIAPQLDGASISRRLADTSPTLPMRFGLFYFAANAGVSSAGDAYRLLIEGAKFADTHDFDAVWTPERHFHAFGGLYPNPAITAAALATITSRVQLRAGSVVLPLHDPIRVAEEWAVIDQLSGGRVGLSFASGWHANDFVLAPEEYDRRREALKEKMDTVLRLWRGERISRVNGEGAATDVSVFPRPVQPAPPIWLASAGSAETWILAGQLGANVLTNMLGQDIDTLRARIAAYRDARTQAGHATDGVVTVMLHTFVCDDTETARRTVRKPLSAYLATSFDLVKAAPQMFPAFRQPSRRGSFDKTFDASTLTPEDIDALLDHAFARYFETAGLFGTPERALGMIEQLSSIGANEVACLIDFGVPTDDVLASLPHLHRLQELCRARASGAAHATTDTSIAALIRQHGVTHFQCTPSLARVLLADGDSAVALEALDTLLVGGEQLDSATRDRLAALPARVFNMYGPTETTVWSTMARVVAGESTIGRPIAGSQVRIVDRCGMLTPPGVVGELCIGGAGVARGYIGRADLTAARFVLDVASDGRMYRTGDLARMHADGTLEFLGRSDGQIKISGRRIEPAEIESVLLHHGAVRECAVTVADDHAPGTATANPLVAYVVRRDEGTEDESARVRDWARVWDDTYAHPTDGLSADARFATHGWTDSTTGAPIADDDMERWLDATLERIRSLSPRRVLEIGCGTGLILHRLLPHVEQYTATDVSQVALDRIGSALTDAERAKVTLVHQAAHESMPVPVHSVDLVILNSVVQYFPSARYLRSVLSKATACAADGGHVFIGDVRSLPLLDAFHTSVTVARADDAEACAAVATRARLAREREPELVLASAFFDSLVESRDRLADAEVLLKRGTLHDEISRFRYDVILRVAPALSSDPLPVERIESPGIDALRERLTRGMPALLATDIPNARLVALGAAQRALAAGTGTCRDVRAAMAAASGGVDPDSLQELDSAYRVRVRWAASGDPFAFDALFERLPQYEHLPWPDANRARTVAAADLANVPAGTSVAETPALLADELRVHAQRVLPDYMVPAHFVVLDALPRTPNGKLDRRALASLPLTTPPMREPDAYVAPTTDLEADIARVWGELLHTERVGRRDNIFELGANSLLTMQANSRISALVGYRVPLVAMFRYATVESLAAHLSERAESRPPSDSVPLDRSAPRMTAAQRRRALRAALSER